MKGHRQKPVVAAGPDPVPGHDAAPCVVRDRFKRPFDLFFVTLALILLWPVWILLALAIRLEDGGPVLYRQPRLGRGGAVFEILKFRTMVEGAEHGTGPVWPVPHDKRTTRVGRVLRRLHLDELPQFLNILKGEMSLVGPRPERPTLARRIEHTLPGFSARLRVRPGIAGLAQALGANHRTPRHKLRYDNLYIAIMNPWLDLRLCVLCAARVLLPQSRDPARAGTLRLRRTRHGANRSRDAA